MDEVRLKTNQHLYFCIKRSPIAINSINADKKSAHIILL